MRQYGYDEVEWFTPAVWNDGIAYQLGFFLLLVAIALIGYWFQNRR